jgi:tRNA G37 N-methylase TrmD
MERVSIGSFIVSTGSNAALLAWTCNVTELSR